MMAQRTSFQTAWQYAIATMIEITDAVDTRWCVMLDR